MPDQIPFSFASRNVCVIDRNGKEYPLFDIKTASEYTRLNERQATFYRRMWMAFTQQERSK